MGNRLQVVPLAVCLMSVLGCAGTPPEPSPGSSQLIKKARKEYVTGKELQNVNWENLNRAFELYSQYVRKHPEGEHAAEAWYGIAQIQFLDQSYNRALRAVRNGLKRAHRPHIRAALLNWKGRIHWTLNRAEKALRAFRDTERYLEDHPDAERWIDRSNLHYRLGYAYVRTGQFQNGRELFQRVVNDYPDTEAAENAKLKLANMSDFFSVQLGAFQRKKNARSLKRELEKEDLNPYVVSVEDQNGTLFCVRVGRYASFDRALDKARRLESGGRTAIVKP